MVDLSDILDDTDKSEIYESVLSACVNKEGATYEYPLCMTAHCMAINKTVFEEADAMQYVDAETIHGQQMISSKQWTLFMLTQDRP